jgi:hypothetical protein
MPDHSPNNHRELAMTITNRDRRHWIGLAVSVVSLTASLSAHEFWIEPTTFTPAAGSIVGIRARVGDGVLGDPVPRDPSLLEALVVDAGGGRVPVVGREGADPAGLLRIDADRLHVVGYLGKPTPIELQAKKFNTYLEDEGLTSVIAERHRLHAEETSARELFTRCAKTLVMSGHSKTVDRELGLPLELVAEQIPESTGGTHTFRLVYQGQPLKGALVTAIHRRTGERQSQRSDADGRVRLVLPRNGEWLIKSVHMIKAPASTNADWVSYWASLTFERPDGPAPVGPR